MTAGAILVPAYQSFSRVAVKPATDHPKPAAGSTRSAAVLPRHSARASVNEVQ